ncbi:MAG: pentapeptide repeat-containing protein [Anaerolineales bacterium]|nr:pentapeptide repeat-containing protein [Anaerolineales bacterium]
MEVVLIICTILGGFAAIWFFWEKLSPKKSVDNEIEPNADDIVSDDHIDIALRGAEAVAKWRKKHPGLALVLRGANLRRADFVRMDLTDADLSEANLEWADLRWSDLIGANLSGAYLERADFHKADLSRANFRKTNLSNANFEDANLRGTDFSEALFAHTILLNTDMADTKGLSTCYHRGSSTIDLETLKKSGDVPPEFLRGCGLSDDAIKEARSYNIEALSAALTIEGEFYSCFISYTSQDEDFASKLYSDLQESGVRCWFAPDDIRIGDKILDSIFEAIQEHEKVVLILSEHSVSSEWVEDEVTKAFGIERKKNKTIIFPIRIDDKVMTSNEPWTQKIRENRHIGDFSNWRKKDAYKNAFERLMRDLQKDSTVTRKVVDDNNINPPISIPNNYSIQLKVVQTVGAPGIGNGEFQFGGGVDSNGGIFVDETYLYVTDWTNNRLQRFRKDEDNLWTFFDFLGDDKDLYSAIYVNRNGIIFLQGMNLLRKYSGEKMSIEEINIDISNFRRFTVDNEDNIFAQSGSDPNLIKKYDSKGSKILSFGGFGNSDGKFNNSGWSADIISDSVGNIYMLDSGNSRIQKFDNSGNFLKKWKVNISAYSYMAIDEYDRIYVAENGYTLLNRYNTEGILKQQYSIPPGVISGGGSYIFVKGNQFLASSHSDHNIKVFLLE